MTFRDREKQRYKALKENQTDLFTPEAQNDGIYWGSGRGRGKQYYFCIKDEFAEENLFEGIRHSAIEYFSRRNIQWHDGLKSRSIPSNHFCCSQ